jgi:hypothetical protein
MTTIGIDFEWGVGRRYEYEKADRVIRQTSRLRDLRRPLETFSGLYHAFAELDGSPEACLKFARTWGLLRQPAKLDAFERLDDWRGRINEMREWLDVPRYVEMGGIRSRMTQVDVELVSSEAGAKRPMFMRLLPRTLFDAMIFQLAQAEASGASLHTCAQCGRWFEVGASGKRTVAKFCSVQCRNRFHYDRKAKPANRNAPASPAGRSSRQ